MNKKILKNTLNCAKEAYREAILINNALLEEKLLSIITDLNYLYKSSYNEHLRNVKEDIIGNEIEKIKRRVPRWIKNPTQYNSAILNTFMKLSNNNSFSVAVSSLEKHSNLSSDIFYKNFNQMKNIGERNHGKVFEEESGEVKLWEPVAEFIENLYKGENYGI